MLADSEASDKIGVSSDKFAPLRQFWPHLSAHLHSHSTQASEIVQQLIEHRLALPFHAALSAPKSSPELAHSGTESTKAKQDQALLSLAARLQDRLQPPAEAQVLADALSTLGAAGVLTLVMKGLAYSHAFYPQPHSRRSTDHDILVAPEQRKKAHHALLAMGFQAHSAQVFQSICGQASYRKKTLAKPVEIDLHWELGNNFALYQRFDFAELHASAVAVNMGAFSCARPNDFFCAIHCALNYCSDPKPQRSYLALLDLALITHPFGTAQWRQLLALAEKTQTRHVLGVALAEAKNLFGVNSVEFSADPNDPLLRALDARFTTSELWWPMRTPRPFAAKLQFLLRQALPPSEYMQARYGQHAPVAVLHLRRIFSALRSLGASAK
jgi:hypothetical protein